MKKLFLFFIAVLTLAATANQTAAANKAANQLRIYLDPGHGTWGSNDRPMATIPYPLNSSTNLPDTCGFYESNTNLWKVLGMREALINMGVQSSNIMLSRWVNGVNPALSVRAEEAESNNMDMFVSIHSDATGTDDGVNRALFIYRGYDKGTTGSQSSYNGNAVAGSWDMCSTVWEDHYMDEIDPQSNYKRTGTTYNKYIKGDITFYGESNCSWSTRNNGNSYFGYLGVLKHGVPGFLMEGYVHTYEPARHRALNQDYCRQEGVRTARGVARYWNFSGESTGYIMGAVKDAVNSLENNLYTYRSGSVDAKAPINGATVQLYDSNNTLIDTYHTDGNYNGVFVFNNLTPGNYSVKVIKEGFADNTASVTVTANATAYPIVYMSAGTSGEPTGDIITSLDFENEATTYSTISGNVISTAQYGETTVVLTDVPMLYAIDNSTKSISTVPITGLEAQNGLGGTVLFPLRSVAFTSDGKLIGCNKTLNQDSGIGDSDYGVTQQGQIQFYYWNNLTSAPTKWVSSKNAANFYEARMGDAMTVEGTLANCLVTVSGITAQGSQ
ncbi:MAG: carboxypeptidase regulatory-like domain-containing protein, partial [Muribaculaceae bacterium]|nr:carboxypeptidase regulatory-like domain-containing protein [Muribaculaceae bacterium]